MTNKQRMIIFIPIFIVFLIIGNTFTVKSMMGWLSSMNTTYIDTIKSYWGVDLPTPSDKKSLYSNRGWKGDGDAITELYYEHVEDIQTIKSITNNWINDKSILLYRLPDWVVDLVSLEHIKEGGEYFYMYKSSSNYIVFYLNDNKLTIFESYQ